MGVRMRVCAVALLALTGWGRTAWAQTPLFNDEFQGPRGARPAGWRISPGVPDVGLYFVLDNGQLATGNGDDLQVPGGYTYAVVNAAGAAEWTDYAIEVSFWSRQRDGRIIVVGRWQNERNHYAAYLEARQDLSGRGRRAGIEVVRDGLPQLLKEAQDGAQGVTIPKIEGHRSAAEKVRVTVAFQGDTITMSLDGQPVVSARDRTFARGTAGVGQRYSEVFYSGFRVSETAGTPVATPPAEPAAALVVAEAAAPIGPGSQAPVFYWVNMGEGLNRAQADELVRAAESLGYINAHALEHQGAWRVLIGAFFSQPEAEVQQKTLKLEGLAPMGVVATPVDVSVSKEAVMEYSIVSEPTRDAKTVSLLRDALTADGFTPATILAEGALSVVSVGPYASQKQAEDALRRMEERGYAGLKVFSKELVRLPKELGAMSPEHVARMIQSELTHFDQATREKSQEFIRSYIDVIRKEESARNQQELAELRALVDEMRKNQDVIDSIRRGIDQERQKTETIDGLVNRVSEAIDLRRWADARQALDELRQADPNNPHLAIKEQAILFGEKDRGSLVNWVDSELAHLSKEVRTLNARSLEDLQVALKTAESLAADGAAQEALTQFTSIKMNAEQLLTRPELSAEAREALNAAVAAATPRIAELAAKVKELNDARAEREQAQKRMTETMLIVLVCVAGVALIAIAVFAFALTRMQKRQRMLLEQVKEVTLRPALAFGPGGEPLQLESATGRKELEGPESLSPDELGGGAAVADAPAQEEEELEVAPPAMPEVVSAPPAAEFRFSAADEETTETQETKPDDQLLAEFRAPSIESLAAGVRARAAAAAAEAETAPPPPPPPAPESGATAAVSAAFSEADTQPIAPLSLKKDEDLIFADLLPNGGGGAALAAPPAKPPAAPAPAIPTEGMIDLDAIFGVAVEPAPAAAPQSAVAAETAATAGEAVTEADLRTGPGQATSFEERLGHQRDGMPPQGWTGEYPYATLTVESEGAGPAMRKFIKYQKSKGAGSAFFSRRFPDMKGVLSVDFDICCREKNKYLLGLYVEKDGDFRQSVHTIAHRTDSLAASSLRIQGEPTPYKFGEWAHVRYEIDLNAGRATGYVNGVKIADNVELSSCPSRLNTISIRDNLATTGVLLIGGIKICSLA